MLFAVGDVISKAEYIASACNCIGWIAGNGHLSHERLESVCYVSGDVSRLLARRDDVDR